MQLKQIVPLLLLYASECETIYGRTRFQKMIFLAQKEGRNVKEWYNFFPHDFGPYSAELQEDLDFLKGEELVNELPERYGEKIRYQYYLTEKGEDIVKKVLMSKKYKKSLIPTLNALDKIKVEYSGLSLELLINDVYRKHPEYAIYSKLVND